MITLLPNRSASWEETRLFLFLLCGTTLAIGLFWAFAGIWAVLPFSGIEAGLVAYIMYRVSRATYQRQVIIFSEREILVQFGMYFPKKSWSLQRQASRLSVVQPKHHLDPLRLNIFDPEHSIAVGEFLNKQDAQKALQEFKNAGLNIQTFNRLNQQSF